MWFKRLLNPYRYSIEATCYKSEYLKYFVTIIDHVQDMVKETDKHGQINVRRVNNISYKYADRAIQDIKKYAEEIMVHYNSAEKSKISYYVTIDKTDIIVYMSGRSIVSDLERRVIFFKVSRHIRFYAKKHKLIFCDEPAK